MDMPMSEGSQHQSEERHKQHLNGNNRIYERAKMYTRRWVENGERYRPTKIPNVVRWVRAGITEIGSTMLRKEVHSHAGKNQQSYDALPSNSPLVSCPHIRSSSATARSAVR
jgi:hypothetical protein